MILTKPVLEIYSREPVGCGIFDRFLNVDNCQLEVVSDVKSVRADQDVDVDVHTNFGNSRLKLPKASFSAPLRT